MSREESGKKFDVGNTCLNKQNYLMDNLENISVEVQSATIVIPDITGFTRFMSDIDLKISKRVIPALLNKIIYTNQVGLKVSEIEGDAVLFYKTGPPVDAQQMAKQCQRFYLDFYQQLKSLKYELRNKPESNKIPRMLGLKIIVLYGEVGMSRIGKRIKLIGEDVIIAHRLLKNDITYDDYVLLTSSYVDKMGEKPTRKAFFWDDVRKGHSNYEHIGKIPYHYVNLEPLLALQKGLRLNTNIDRWFYPGFSVRIFGIQVGSAISLHLKNPTAIYYHLPEIIKILLNLMQYQNEA